MAPSMLSVPLAAIVFRHGLYDTRWPEAFAFTPSWNESICTCALVRSLRVGKVPARVIAECVEGVIDRRGALTAGGRRGR